MTQLDAHLTGDKEVVGLMPVRSIYILPDINHEMFSMEIVTLRRFKKSRC